MLRIRKIVCPVDFFQPSDAALSYAALFARTCDAAIHLVHVIPPVTSMMSSSEEIGKHVKAAHQQAERKLSALSDRFSSEHIRTSTEVRFGEIDGQILEAVAERKADLVLMGTHGRRGFERWLLGSVFERVLRTLPAPIMAVRTARRGSAKRPRISKVVVGVDFSTGSEGAVAFGLFVAGAFNAELTLLHVPDFVMGDVPNPYKEPALEGILLKLKSMIPPDAERAKVHVEFGTPHQVILNFSDRVHADLIVLGTHGKTMLDRTLLGSSADRVIRGTSCPVLVIPPS